MRFLCVFLVKSVSEDAMIRKARQRGRLHSQQTQKLAMANSNIGRVRRTTKGSAAPSLREPSLLLVQDICSSSSCKGVSRLSTAALPVWCWRTPSGSHQGDRILVFSRPAKGSTPICINMPMVSASPQCSTMRPSAMRSILMPLTCTMQPVGSICIHTPV